MDEQPGPDFPSPAGYRLETLLGQGAMGKVFVATQLNLKRRVALKVLRAGGLSEAESRRRFLDEARILARLSHPNIVALYDGVVDGDECFLAMELVEGSTLDGVLQRSGPLAGPRAVEISIGILEGLAYIHSAGVLHRDLKPGNILMASGRVPKLADFGLSRIVGAERVTAEGYIVGTPMYMAPEVLNGADATPLSDIYSFGVVLFRMLTRRHLIDPAARGFEVIAAKLSLDRTKVLAQLQGVAPALAEVVARCVAAAPDERPSSARELLELMPQARSVAGSSGRRQAAGGVASVDDSCGARPAVGDASPAAAAVQGARSPGELQRKVRGDKPVQPAPPLAPGGASRPRIGRLLSAAALLVASALLAWGLRPPPMALQPGCIEAGPACRPIPGACEVRWRSARPYLARLLVGESLYAEPATTSIHSVVVTSVPWARPPEARIVLPDGSKSSPFSLAAVPLPVAPRLEHLGDRAVFSLEVPHPCSLELELRAPGRPAQVIRLPASRSHRHELPVLDRREAAELTVRLGGSPLLPDTLPPLSIRAPAPVATRLLEDLKALVVARIVERLMGFWSGRSSRATARTQLERELGRLDWRRRAREDGGIWRWALRPANTSPEFAGYLLHYLSGIRQLDQAALYNRVDLRTGLDEALGEDWRARSGEPPGRTIFEHAADPPIALVTKDLDTAWRMASGDQGASPVRMLEVALPDLSFATRVWIGFLVPEARPEGMVCFWLGRAVGKRETYCLSVYDRPELSRVPAWQSHALDARALSAGPNTLVMGFKPLPGTLATGIKISAVRVTME